MADLGIYAGSPIAAFSYTLRVELIYDIPVKSVRGFTRNNNYERIQQGGVNDYVIMRRKPITEPFTFQVERYISNTLTDPLANGAEMISPIFLTINKDANGDTGRVYMFTGCIVTGKEYAEMNAERSTLATEIVTIAYREMFVLPNILSLGGGT